LVSALFSASLAELAKVDDGDAVVPGSADGNGQGDDGWTLRGSPLTVDGEGGVSILGLVQITFFF
jgi:hypothetical protein